MGFAPSARFKVYPTFWGLRFGDDSAEPSFYGYDHPAVHFFERTGGFDVAWEEWRAALLEDPRCADGALGGLASVLQREDLDRAKVLLQEIETDYPDMRLAALVAADLYGKLVKKRGTVGVGSLCLGVWERVARGTIAALGGRGEFGRFEFVGIGAYDIGRWGE